MLPAFAVVGLAALAMTGPCTPAQAAGGATALSASAAAATRRPLRAPVPAANFVVEWRLHAVEATAARGDVVITSGSASVGGATGYAPGAVVVGTARAAAPQAVRVANGKEASLLFDTAQTHTVYDLAWSSASDARSTSAGDPAAPGSSRAQSRAQGVAGHEVSVHHVDGLRVTPHWTRGDTLLLDLELMHGAPAPTGGATNGESRATRDIAFRSTVELSIDEWLGVARVGGGTEELQVRVSWR